MNKLLTKIFTTKGLKIASLIVTGVGGVFTLISGCIDQKLMSSEIAEQVSKAVQEQLKK